MSFLAPDRVQEMARRDIAAIHDLLAGLPPEGLTLTPTEWADRLYPITRKRSAYTHQPAGVIQFLARYEETLRLAGWGFTATRTRTARSIRIAPV